MSGKLSFAAAAVAAGLLFASAPGMATTAGSIGALKDVGASQTLVEKAHGWHRTCQRGLNGYHKHVPGVGRVQCTTHKCWTNSWGVRRCKWF